MAWEVFFCKIQSPSQVLLVDSGGLQFFGVNALPKSQRDAVGIPWHTMAEV